MRSTNLAKNTSIKDRYEKELGQLPDVEPRPLRGTDVTAVIESIGRLQRTTGRLTSAFVFLTMALVALAVADHWTAVRAALVGLDLWRQQWLH